MILLLLGVAAADFEVTDFQYGKSKLKVLTNTETGENASVIVNYGGCVDELFLRTKRGKLKRILWDHDRNSTAVETNPTWKGRMLLPYANRIGGATYMFNGTREHLPVNDVAGLNNSLHGLLWNKEMELVDGSAISGPKSASITLRHTFGDGTDKGYPFLLRVDIRYTLDATGFWLQVHATNMDPNGWPLPFYNGWHPYFLVADMSKARIVLDNCSAHTHVDVNTGPQYPPPRYSDMVPSTHVSPWNRNNGTDAIGGNTTDPTYMDDEVKVLSPENCTGPFFSTRLVDPVLGDTTVLMHDRSFRYLQIFTGAKATWGVDAVVLEPLSSMSDAYNNHDGLHVISAGESFTNNFGVRLE
jgi:aldose 1-epimerase